MNDFSNGTNNNTMVSIICAAYNHEKYISKAIDGFLMQKTNFKYEILIHEDASTDNTAKIIKKYELQYPDIIKVIYQKENQYSQGINVFEILLNKAKGKYLAFCEGDDYWIDCNKLQKQVDFLENNKNFSAIFHNAIVVDENNKAKVNEQYVCPLYGNYEKRKGTLLPNNLVGQIGTLVCLNYWKILIKQKGKNFLDAYRQNVKTGAGDAKVNLILNQMGDIYHSQMIMSCYRRTYTGSSFNARIKNLDLSKSWYDSIKILNTIIVSIFGKGLEAYLIEEAENILVEGYFIKFMRTKDIKDLNIFWSIFIYHKAKSSFCVHFIKRICKYIFKINNANRYPLSNEYFLNFKERRKGYEF